MEPTLADSRRVGHLIRCGALALFGLFGLLILVGLWRASPAAAASLGGPISQLDSSSSSSSSTVSTSTVNELVGTVTQTVAPVGQSATKATAPVTRAVSGTVAPVAQSVAQTVAPVTQAVAPVTGAVSRTVAPVAQSVARTVTPVTQAVAPVTGAVSRTVEPVAQSVAQTVVGPVTQVVAPVIEAVGPVSDAIAPVTRVVASVTPAIAPVTTLVTTTVTQVTTPVVIDPGAPTPAGSTVGTGAHAGPGSTGGRDGATLAGVSSSTLPTPIPTSTSTTASAPGAAVAHLTGRSSSTPDRSTSEMTFCARDGLSSRPELVLSGEPAPAREPLIGPLGGAQPVPSGPAGGIGASGGAATFGRISASEGIARSGVVTPVRWSDATALSFLEYAEVERPG